MKTEQKLTLDTCVVAAPDQASCLLESEAVLLSLRNGEYFGLNEVGASIWQIIQCPRTVTEVRDELMAEYDGVDAEVCAAEVLGFLERMVTLGLVDTK
jgi:hypothetical protein